jgi:general stress protein CsbA
MAVARNLRVLDLYDVLSNLIPGAVLLLSLVVLLHLEPVLNQYNSGFVIVIISASSLILGHIIQALSSWILGSSNLFGRTIKTARNTHYSSLPLESDNEEITITQIEWLFWMLCQLYFGLRVSFTDYGKLIKMVLAHLETTPAVRALRFQAIWTFYRSMVMTSILIFLSSLILYVREIYITCVLRGPAPLVAGIPSLRVGIFLSLSLFAGIIFHIQKKKRDKIFVQYVIIEFYNDRISHFHSDNYE